MLTNIELGTELLKLGIHESASFKHAETKGGEAVWMHYTRVFGGWVLIQHSGNKHVISRSNKYYTVFIPYMEP